ncbi:GntR family transcriptional regulator [Thioclava sp. SK-1]|uniref:GntR family transcriptional regulator n=1 Tax=Thioclava sp. SK-1 TaxID=1889770 RepID=UPI001C4013AC|nr:GntR family transcriptional regulator [Thioclava sp. SK-1]
MQDPIEKTLLAAITEGRLTPGSRLSENELAKAFAVSRTKVREALTRLQSRHVVSVQPRRGWFVNIPDAAEAAEVFAARRSVEYGFLATAAPFGSTEVNALAAHMAEERRAIAQEDRAMLTCLMGDFHVRIVEQSGNRPLIEVMRNLTARTILISLRYQSNRNALASHEDHCAIFDAIAAGDMTTAAALSRDHLDDVESGLRIDIGPSSLDTLRHTLRLDQVPTGADREGTLSNDTILHDRDI